MTTKRKGPTTSLSRRRLAEMTEQATVDANGESEAQSGWFTMFEEHLKLPFETEVLGVQVIVERVELDDRDEIVAVCGRGPRRQRIPILHVPLPAPAPEGAEWIEAYRHWRGT